MAATNTAGKQKVALPKLGLRQYPVKRSINLIAVGKKPINYSLVIPSLILLIALIVLFSKFLVIDRLAEVAAAQKQVSEYQARLDADYREIAGFEDLNEVYAHYTYSGFTQEELARPSRVAVLDMIRKGLTMGIGTDGYNCDILEGMKLVNVLHKLNTRDPRVSWAEPPLLAFKNNSIIAERQFGYPIGVITKGGAGDVVIVDYKPWTPMTNENLFVKVKIQITN